MKSWLQIIRRWTEIILDFVFPPSHDRILVRQATHHELHTHVRAIQTNGVLSLLRYERALTRALIHEAKFHGNVQAWELLSTVLAEHLKKNLPPHEVLLVPIPLSSERLRTRGYNQSYEIARRAVANFPHYRVASDLLIRTRDTRPQTELKRAMRLTNLIDAFRATHPERIRGKHIILIDDVTTTGATLHGARTAIEPHTPASIICIALAH